MLWLPVVLVLVAFTLACCALLIHCEHRKMASIPGPPRSSFFFGNLKDIVASQKSGVMFEEQLYQWHLKYGYTIVIFLFHKPLISCMDPAIVKDVLLHHPRAYAKARMYERIGFIFGERTLGGGLVTQRDYESWAMQRLALNPVFHRKCLASLVPEFNATAAELTNVLASFSSSGQSVDLSVYFQKSTHDVIAKIVFGKPPGDFRKDSPLEVAAKGLLKGISESFMSAFPEWSPWMYDERVRYRRHVNAIKKDSLDAVHERLNAIRAGHHVPDDILTAIVKAHTEDPRFTMELVLDNMITFFVAGQETSANALSFIVMELGKHPEVLRKTIEEVRSIVGQKSFISLEDTNSMKYCTMVIKEALRLYPIGLGTQRHFHEAVTCGQITIPAGCDVKFSAYVSGRHPDFFENALAFVPERFDTENEQRIPTTVYFPFSLGTRSCIGQNFAMIEMKIILAKLLQRFDFTLDKSHSFGVDQHGTLHPVDGVWAKLSDC